ncbi:MAG: hypothetical protein KatS3mg102_2781 [Planctomycetota bacterium]|nr:MAG: hypothetical protein KatS3mg102_2781 [Planctomycetota bacterium]
MRRELGLGEQVRVIRGDALQVLPRLAAAGERFELVFVAPP